MASVIWAKNRGRNGWDSLVDVGLDESVESLNVHLYNHGLGTRRGGSTSVTITGVTAPINAAFEFIPGQDETAAELFVVDSSGTTKILRCAGGSSFTNLTLADNVQTSPTMVSAAVLNGKLFLAYDSSVNRLHVYDPNFATANYVRRTGINTENAPTVTNTGGGGSYAAVLRYYKAAETEQQSGVTVRRSPLSSSASFTPDGSHLNATVTKASASGEGGTHWEVYGSPDNILYYALAADIPGALSGAIAIGTTTYVDTTAVSTYANYTAAPEDGSNTLLPSLKSIGTDGSRLYGLGVWEASAAASYEMTPKPGRFYFTPVLDSSGVGDDERINNTATLRGWIDLSRNANAIDRGVSPHPVNNVVYAFQSSGVFGLYPTDAAVTPYRRVVLSTAIGNLAQQMIVMAHDRTGSPCCYFWDPVKGPYVVGGSDGLRWCGKDVIDLVARINRDATTICGWGLFYPDLNQVWFVIAIDGNNTPGAAVVLDVTKQQLDESGDLRGGWTLYNGDLATAPCGVLFSNTLSATRSRVKVPYTAGNSKLLRYDTSVQRDDSVAFQASVTSGSLFIENAHVSLLQPYVLADAASAVTIQHRIIRNAGAETRDTTLTLTASEGSEAIVLRKAADAAMNDAWTLQIQLGDAAAANVHWLLHQWRCPNVKAGSVL